MKTKYETLTLLSNKKNIDEANLAIAIKNLFSKFKISRKNSLPIYVIELFKQQYESFSDIEKQNFSQEVFMNVGTNIGCSIKVKKFPNFLPLI